jgi:glycosyltransferase involved in cell wall biosynthesis
MKPDHKVHYSVLVPAYNEEENILLVAQKFAEVFAETGDNGEVVFIDDGSTDKTKAEAEKARNEFSFVKVVSYPRNQGKTSALSAGFNAAAGGIYVIFDADLQFDPWDVPRLVSEIDKGADISTGWKQGKYEKRFVSGVYNWLCRKLFKIEIHDLNSIKAFKKEILENITLREDWHRYLVVLAAEQGYRISEIKVTLRPRLHGTSKYSGAGRILTGFLDLLSVKFQASFMKKPMLLFGTVGLILTILGTLTGVAALILRFGFGIGFRPLLNLVMLLVISGILFFILGFLAEAVANVSDKVDDLKKSLPGRTDSK